MGSWGSLPKHGAGGAPGCRRWGGWWLGRGEGAGVEEEGEDGKRRMGRKERMISNKDSFS